MYIKMSSKMSPPGTNPFQDILNIYFHIRLNPINNFFMVTSSLVAWKLVAKRLILIIQS